MSDQSFNNLELKKKRPFWVEALSFMFLIGGVWMGTHFAMNYGAYSQIFAFRYESMQASVISDLETMKTEAEAAEALANYEPELEKVRIKVPVKKVQKKLEPKKSRAVFEKMAIFPSDNRVVIPRIGKNVPLIDVPSHQNWKQLEGNIQEGLRNGVVVHPVSHDPGNFGNFFLTGHSSYYAWDKGRFKDVFALLHEVIPGDIVEVYWEGKKYTYKMREKKVIEPTEVSVLKQPKDKQVMTMMTCTPVGTNKQRLILVGDLKSVE